MIHKKILARKRLLSYLINFKTIGPDRILENEAFRIMSTFKVLKPASYNGKNVKMNYEIPISFRLD